jgi:hypothetical protein
MQREKEHNFKNTQMFTNPGILNDILKPDLVQRQSRLKMCIILAVPSLFYGYKIWT